MEPNTNRTANATLEQAAQFLQVSLRTVQNYMDKGLLNPIRFGRRRFFKWAELEKLAKHGVPQESSKQ